MQEVGSQNYQKKGESSGRTVLQVSKQSRESLASSSHVSSSSFPPCSRACSDMRKKHQPSKYQASTSSSSEAMIPCKTIKAGVNSDNSRKSLVKFNRLEMGGSRGSSTERTLDGALAEETSWTCLRPSLSMTARISEGFPWPHRASLETCERTQGSVMLPYFPGRLVAQT
jgi:hypothetical protein